MARKKKEKDQNLDGDFLNADKEELAIQQNVVELEDYSDEPPAGFKFEKLK